MGYCQTSIPFGPIRNIPNLMNITFVKMSAILLLWIHFFILMLIAFSMNDFPFPYLAFLSNYLHTTHSPGAVTLHDVITNWYQ